MMFLEEMKNLEGLRQSFHITSKCDFLKKKSIISHKTFLILRSKLHSSLPLPLALPQTYMQSLQICAVVCFTNLFSFSSLITSYFTWKDFLFKKQKNTLQRLDYDANHAGCTIDIMFPTIFEEVLAFLVNEESPIDLRFLNRVIFKGKCPKMVASSSVSESYSCPSSRSIGCTLSSCTKTTTQWSMRTPSAQLTIELNFLREDQIGIVEEMKGPVEETSLFQNKEVNLKEEGRVSG